MITSRSNPKIKQVRALRQRKTRQETSLFLVEGIHPVGEASEAAEAGNLPGFDSIFYAPELLHSEFALDLIEAQSARGVPCYETTAEVFASIASKDNPQGILAVLHQKDYELEHLKPQNFPWGVALVAPQDPGNLGTILRTVDAAGASGVLLLDSSVDRYHPSAVRASMGTLFWHPVTGISFEEFENWARLHRYHIYGTSSHADLDYREIPVYEFPRILLMGSEREGLTTRQASICQHLVRLPMLGRASSLNLAVATGVMLYAMLRSKSD